MNAFDRTLRDHLGWIARLAFRFCRRKADADDLAQETLLRICAARDRFDRTRDFKPWALTIMTNIFKTRQARTACVPFVPLDSIGDNPDSLRADDLAHWDDCVSVIRKASRRSVCVGAVLLYAKGYSYDEIAAIEGVAAGTVKSRILAGRRILAEMLEENMRKRRRKAP